MEETSNLLNDLVGHLGKSMGLDELGLDEDGFCTVAFDGGVAVTIHSNPDAGTAILSAEIGTVAPENEAELLRAMLEANYAWGQTGGVGTLCLEPQTDDAAAPSGAASVMHQTPVRSLDEATFHSLFDRFLDVTEAWSEFLAESQAGAATDGEPAAVSAEADPTLRRV